MQTTSKTLRYFYTLVVFNIALFNRFKFYTAKYGSNGFMDAERINIKDKTGKNES